MDFKTHYQPRRTFAATHAGGRLSYALLFLLGMGFSYVLVMWNTPYTVTHQNGLEHVDTQLRSIKAELSALSAQFHATTAVNKTGSYASSAPKKLYLDDFWKYFNVKPLTRTLVDPLVRPYLEKHDITKDPDYADAIERDLVNLYGPIIEQGFEGDRRFYIKFCEKSRGYGMFADVDIQPGKVIGEYVGVLTNSTASTDYQWTYLSEPLNEHKEKVLLSIDSRYIGNLLRFANHEDKANCDVVFVPYKQQWHVLYVANAFIPAGGEVFVNYGPDYWATRHKVTTVN